MNTRIAQSIEKGPDDRWRISGDWFPASLPDNLEAGDLAYLDTSYSFTGFRSTKPGGFKIGYASGNYLHSNFFSGEAGEIDIGEYVILEATNIHSNKKITIRDHCMCSWGSVLTDSWIEERSFNSEVRKMILEAASSSASRYPQLPFPKPITIEENVWVGFDAVILPGVHIGEGAVIGCKSIVTENVPPYAVVAGNPAKIIKLLEPIESDRIKNSAIQEYSKQSND